MFVNSWLGNKTKVKEQLLYTTHTQLTLSTTVKSLNLLHNYLSYTPGKKFW